MCLLCLACSTDSKSSETDVAAKDTRIENAATDTLVKEPLPQLVQPKVLLSVPDGWLDLAQADSLFIVDLRYATTNNFVDTVLYPCGRCLLRKGAGKKILSAQKVLWERHQLRFVLFDCYRPQPVQWALWRKVPNPQYVADPRKGSMHNRGMAVDIGLADAEGKLLDMGTEFDYFGAPAYHDYTDHPEEVLERRKLLKALMDEVGFRSTRTEWWHYSERATLAPIAKFVWECLPQDSAKQ